MRIDAARFTRTLHHFSVQPAAVLLLLLIHAGLLGYGAVVHSPTMDDVAHLPAGISHWQFGRFELYSVNPPLVRMVAALPVIFARPLLDWKRLDESRRPEWNIGIDFILANRERSFWFFTTARWACIPFSLLGGYICYRWASQLYGPAAGLLALTLWCFCPNILAHAQLITPDAGATALCISSTYCFWRWLKSPTWSNAILAGIVLGLAQLTKTTLLILFLLWPFLWYFWKLTKTRPLVWRHQVTEAVQLGSAILIAVYIINLAYGFQGSFTRLSDCEFYSEALSGEVFADSVSGVAIPGNRFHDSWLGSLPVPLPMDYVLGIDLQKSALDRKSWSYMNGQWKVGGWWYFYLYALAIKVPLGTLCLIILVLGLKFSRFGLPGHWSDEVILFAPIVAILALVSVNTGFTRHLRYVLPIFPFAFICLGQVAALFTAHVWKTSVVTVLLLAWSLASSLSIFPHSFSYFNELGGGPVCGHAHLIVTNIDWGQDLLFLKRWLQEHPEAHPIGVAYFGHVPAAIAGIDSSTPPLGRLSIEEGMNVEFSELGPKPGWYAISVSLLRDRRRLYEYFLRFEPVAMAGYSIYIYHITLEEANRVRRELGLPTLPLRKTR